MRYVIGLAVVFLSGLASLTTATAEKRVALVIGNAKYEHIAGLPNVPNDARAMEALFKAAKFDSVVVLHDKRLAELRKELLNFAERAAKADVAVVFYAGHGIEVDRVNYLIPVDARLKSDLAVEDETVSLDRVLKLMEQARKLRVVILDACRDNPFVKSMRLTAATRSVTRGLGRIEAGGANTLIAFATEPHSVADDGPGPNSPFTAALLKHLTTPGLDLRIALGSVRDDVMANTKARQKPYVTSSMGGGSIALVPGTVAAASQAQLSKAERDWAAVKGTSDTARLRAFADHYKGTVYADLARARIEEVRKEVAATSLPTSKLSPKTFPEDHQDYQPLAVAYLAAPYQRVLRGPSKTFRLGAETPGTSLSARLVEREKVQHPWEGELIDLFKGRVPQPENRLSFEGSALGLGGLAPLSLRLYAFMPESRGVKVSKVRVWDSDAWFQKPDEFSILSGATFQLEAFLLEKGEPVIFPEIIACVNKRSRPPVCDGSTGAVIEDPLTGQPSLLMVARGGPPNWLERVPTEICVEREKGHIVLVPESSQYIALDHMVGARWCSAALVLNYIRLRDEGLRMGSLEPKKQLDSRFAPDTNWRMWAETPKAVRARDKDVWVQRIVLLPPTPRER